MAPQRASSDRAARYERRDTGYVSHFTGKARRSPHDRLPNSESYDENLLAVHQEIRGMNHE